MSATMRAKHTCSHWLSESLSCMEAMYTGCWPVLVGSGLWEKMRIDHHSTGMRAPGWVLAPMPMLSRRTLNDYCLRFHRTLQSRDCQKRPSSRRFLRFGKGLQDLLTHHVNPGKRRNPVTSLLPPCYHNLADSCWALCPLARSPSRRKRRYNI
jgi:hypothetical protein